jgi:hypothetical protein
MIEPVPMAVSDELEKRKNEDRDLTRAYQRFFFSEDGKRILADLETKCQWGKNPYLAGITGKDLAYRCGLLEPIRYIHTRKDRPLDPLGKKEKKRTAKSGTNL